MKKRYLVFLLTFIIMMTPKVALAAPSVSMSCRSSGTVSVGSTISVTVSGSSSEDAMWDMTTYSNDESKLKISGTSRYVSDDFFKNTSRTYKFIATDVGTVTVSSHATVSNYSGEKGNGSTSCLIKVVSKSSSNNSTSSTKKEEKEKSSDNSLKSLEIEGASLNPEFNKDTLEYSVNIENDEKTKINIKATSNDNKAKIEGIGEKDIDFGINKFEISVKAENGTIRTYVVNVTLSEKNPIIVKVNGKKYKVMKKINGIDAPNGYEKDTIKIKGKEVEVYKNKTTKYTLVALIDEDDKSSLFIYKNNEYIEYNEFSNSSLRLLILSNNKKAPYKYKKSIFSIDNKNIKGYLFDENSDFRLVYALNLDTNEKDFYLYDLNQKTFQRFYSQQTNIYISLVKKCKTLFMIVGAIIFILFILWVVTLTRGLKFKKNYINKVEKAKNNVKYQDVNSDEVKKHDKKTFLDE